MSNSNSWNLENVNLSEDKINKNIKETAKQLKQDVNFLLNLINKYDSLELLKFMAFHTDEVLERSKTKQNIHNEEVAYSQLLFVLKYVASNSNPMGTSKNLTDFSWKKFNRTFSNYENHLIKYTDNLILKEHVDSLIRSRMQDKFYSYMFPLPRTKFEEIATKKQQLKLILQPYLDKINETFNSGLDNVLDSLELMAKVGTRGIYDLNKDCALFAKRSQSKIDDLKICGSNKSNKELLGQIISEEGWQNWINSIQARSEDFDLFDVKRITNMDPNELEMLSVIAYSKHSDHFCWLTESAGFDDSLFIKVNENFYCFDGMFIFDKAYQAIKSAVIKKFPGYENTWNSIEKKKAGLLPVSILAGVFGHSNYSLNYAVEDSFFTAFFETESGNIYFQVPRQYGYIIPLNPIKEIVRTKYAFDSYDLSVKDFDKIDSKIVVLDSFNEMTNKIKKVENVFYLSSSYLASIINEGYERRLLRDTILGKASVNNDNKEKNIVNDLKTISKLIPENKEDVQQLSNIISEKNNNKDTIIEEKSDTIKAMNHSLLDNQKENNEFDIEEEEVESFEDLINEEFERETVDNNDRLNENTQPIDDLAEENITDLDKSEINSSELTEKNKSFSLFDVLNNVAQGKEPLNQRNELSEDLIKNKNIDDNNNFQKENNDSKLFSMSDVLNNVAKGKTPLETSDKSEINEKKEIFQDSKLKDIDKSNNKTIEEKPSNLGFSFFDVLNNVASGKDPLTGENENKKQLNEDAYCKTEPSDIITNINDDKNIVVQEDMNEIVEVDLNSDEMFLDSSNIEKILDEEDDDIYIDEEELPELLEVEQSDDSLRELFDDDINDELDLVMDDDLSDVELNSIVEPEDEDENQDEEVQESSIDDINYLTDKEKLNTPLISSSSEESDNNILPKEVSPVVMMNSVNEILSEIDDSDLDDYGIESELDNMENENLFALNDSEDISMKKSNDISNSNYKENEQVKVIAEEVAPIEEVVTPIKEVVTPIKEVVTPIKEVVTPIKEIGTPIKEEITLNDNFSAIEENRIMEEEIPSFESIWPSSIIDIVGMLDSLDDSIFFNICKANDIELLNAIDYLIGKALDSQKVDGKDKMFTIPESNLSIVLPTNKNDQLKKWERMTSLGALMYSKDMDSWNALTLNYDEEKKLKTIKEWSITKDSYSSVDWKFVVTTGFRLKKKNKK